MDTDDTDHGESLELIGIIESDQRRLLSRSTKCKYEENTEYEKKYRIRKKYIWYMDKGCIHKKKLLSFSISYIREK